jgi:hypothetical protein
VSMIAGDFSGRRAPYAPISALQRFFTRIRDRQAPETIDHTFLEKLNVASNNEYALLSALKFLGVVDERGKPTHAYRLLQTTDRFESTLRHLVLTAYKPVFDAGGEDWPQEDLVNFFRVSSSASQAKNAARFFYAVCRLAGLGPGGAPVEADITPSEAADDVPAASLPRDGREKAAEAGLPPAVSGELLRAKAHLLEKLPAADPSWSAAEYQAVCDRFLAMLDSLDRSAQL